MGENNVNSDIWLSKGLTAYNLRNYEEAIKCYNKALELDPNFKEAWFRKGMAIGVLGNYEVAIECHENAIEIDPE